MLMIGQMIYGFAGGYFGRDSYADKRIEAVGIDWVVCRDEEGGLHFACLPGETDFHNILMPFTDKED